MERELVDLLEEYVTPNKVEVINSVLSERTRHLTVVLEDFYQSQNASAVLRSCDCFGIQDLYITQNLHDYIVNPNVVRGASKWITQHLYERESDSMQNCIRDLRNKNYRLVGTTPDPKAASIHELDITQPTAIIFGTEKAGLSDYAKGEVDELVRIPMYGFTESFNVSVSAALILQELVTRLKNSELNWELSEKDKIELKLEWYKRIVKRSDLHVNSFLKERS